MGYIWIIYEYAVNKGGIRVQTNTPHFSNFDLFWCGVLITLKNYFVKLNLFPV